MNRPERRRTTAVRRVSSVLALVAAAILVLLGLGVPAASAHDALVGATPADGATVTAAPTEVALEFSALVQELGAEVAVSGPDGAAVSRGSAEVVDTTLTQPLEPDLPAGTYSVVWRVTSADGHPISGATTFTVAGDGAVPADPVQEASAARPAGSSSPTLAIGVGAGVVLVLALVLGARQLRGRR